MKVNRDLSSKEKNESRKEKRHSQIRAEILEAASAIVFRDGVTGLRLEVLGKELGLTKQAVYYYFKSKEAVIFQLILNENLEMANEVSLAIEKTKTAIQGLEALMYTVFNRYKGRMDLFRLAFHYFPNTDFEKQIGKEALEEVRPVNDLLYSAIEERLRVIQNTGHFPKQRNPRRFVFTAHMSVVGILNMLALAGAAQDKLIHKDEDLIDDIYETFKNVISRRTKNES